MKPDWKDAPEWANWLAMDGDSDWYWYEHEPELGDYGDWRRIKGRSLCAQRAHLNNYEDSLERRP